MPIPYDNVHCFIDADPTRQWKNTTYVYNQQNHIVVFVSRVLLLLINVGVAK